MTTTTAAPAHLTTVPTRGAAPRRTSPRALSLLTRAQSLHAQARLVNPIVAQAYVRRATELQLAARAERAWAAGSDTDDAPAAA